jgi:hypothetical protein
VKRGFDLKEYRLKPLMSVNSAPVKKCSACKCTLLLEKYFEINRKGEYYKTCNGCRSKHQSYNEKSRIKHYDDVKVCDKCGYEVKFNKSLGTHQRSWTCYRRASGIVVEGDEFDKWIYDNRDNLLSKYKDFVPRAVSKFGSPQEPPRIAPAVEPQGSEALVP